MVKPLLNTTSHGLNVLRIPMQSVESLTAMVLVNTGSRYESPDKQGIAHFFEHLVFKGTDQYPNAHSLSSTIDGIGADFNAFTSKEYTGYYVKTASRHLDTALNVLSDMLLKPKLLQPDIDRELGVILEEINMYKDTPMQYVGMLFDQLVFPDKGLGHDILGTKETVSSVKREDVVKLLSEWYGLGNMVLVLAGDAKVLNADTLLNSVDSYFSKETEKPRVEGVRSTQEYYDKTPFTQEKLRVLSKDTEQAHLVMAWPGLKRSDERRHTQAVLSSLLGGTMSSRLFTEVREKRGLCYYVRSDVDYYQDVGLAGASAGIDPKRIHEALPVIKQEFLDLASGAKPVSKEELVRAQENIVGTMTLSFEDSRSVAQYFASKQLLMNSLETPEEIWKKILAVTIDEVHALAKELFLPGEMRLSVIGPFKEEEFACYV